jgi:small subunit ribosomal protein S2
MAGISMKALLESGVHFGHRTNKWDPRMKPYIFTERNGIHILDLQQTVKLANQAYNVIRDTVANGGTVLFVGTKRQAQETVAEEASRCGMPYVTERWMGGMLTNWSTMYQRIQELERLENLRDSGEINRLTKKEGLLIERDINRLQTRLSGARIMKRVPELLFIVDVGREDSAVREANLLKIPIVALVDTNCNPLDIDYVIPSNDDAIRAIKLLVAKMADAVLEGKAMRKEEEPEQVEEVRPERKGKSRPARKPAGELQPEEEMGDEALLGEATLAKLNVNRQDETAEAEAKPAPGEPAKADEEAKSSESGESKDESSEAKSE